MTAAFPAQLAAASVLDAEMLVAELSLDGRI